MSKRRILVAMSGGVDSSVAAFLLKQQGHDVIGATLNLWSYENREEPYNECCSFEVKAVAQQLGIEHHWVDEGVDFKSAVVDPFIEDYLAGLTPSPCARCNRLVRFPKLLELADKLDCELLATGHHARIAEESGTYHLLKGHDPLKDQSYYLYGLNQKQLSRVLFPVGSLHKREVWQIARENNLVSARKPESQDLCFLPFGDQRRYLQQHANGSLRPGEILDTEGNVVGNHEGLALYTVGQRRGLGVSMGHKIYVVGLNPQQNQVIVGPEQALYSAGLIADQSHWIAGEPIKCEERAEVKIRYRSASFGALLKPTPDADVIEVQFDEPQRAVTPGQIAVYYRGDSVFGGGRIIRSIQSCNPAPIAYSQVL
ncbi:tRNA 2-thiouridine(34) synthase MnmA [Candidatus Acetothermia bacterium]|nr:tRNA 2-thiouridine(34) synthase MnmA [Candidatus Acetothermia bacterium]MBI3642553.1 tRNA 2-thiouridine(34) synthase MnmA [Candidatus Acetothermia bacterium]